MGIFFGTDGIRGVMNEDLTCELATTCGNALARMKPRGTILVGRDTRLSGSCLTSALAVGAMKAGANVIMPNVTFENCKKNYEIYPNKVSVDYESLKADLAKIGRTISNQKGFRATHDRT